jgi:HemY protein
MKGLLWLLTLFALAVGIALALHYNNGYVLLVLPPYRAEVSLNLALILVFGGFVFAYGILRTIALARSLPRRVREFRQRRQSEKMAETLFDATRLLFEERYDQSLKRAAEAHAAGQSPALAALIAARAAQGLGDAAKQKTWLGRALQSDVKAQSAALFLEAEMLVELHRYDEALTLLKRLHELAGHHVAALRLELRVHQGRGDEQEIQRISRLLGDHETQGELISSTKINQA